MKARVVRGFLVGAASACAAAAAADLLRPRGGRAEIIDWKEIRVLLQRRLERERSLTGAEIAAAEERYARLAAEVRGSLLKALDAAPSLELPPYQALDRAAWAELNIGILADTMRPLLEAGGLPRNRLTDLGRAGVDRYVAALLGFLSGRVLGQFDPQLFGKEALVGGSLYLVEPNIQAWEQAEGLDGDELRRWLILHESTHAWQFAAHPWLREHMNEQLETLLALAGNARQDVLSRLIGLTVGLPSQWAAIRSLQATMSLVEGYSNLVMNQAGREALPGFDRLERAYRRRSARSALESAFWKLTGLDLKLRQYREGEAFCRAVVERGGMGALNMAWDSVENLPRPDELRAPGAWYERVVGGPVPSARRTKARATAPRPTPG